MDSRLLQGHYQAIRHGSLQVMKLLPEHGADIYGNHSGDPPHCTRTVYLGKEHMDELLPMKGADVNAIRPLGQTALCAEVEGGQKDSGADAFGERYTHQWSNYLFVGIGCG